MCLRGSQPRETASAHNKGPKPLPGVGGREQRESRGCQEEKEHVFKGTGARMLSSS